jgi:hypothetical protein
MSRFGWIYNSQLIRNHYGIGLEEVFELSTLEAVNALSYVKAKASFDREQNG